MSQLLIVMVTPFFNTCHRPSTVLRPPGAFFFNLIILLQPLVAETISIPQRRPLKLRDEVNHQTHRAQRQTDPGPTLSATPSLGFSVSQSKQNMPPLRRWDKVLMRLWGPMGILDLAEWGSQGPVTRCANVTYTKALHCGNKGAAIQPSRHSWPWPVSA